MRQILFLLAAITFGGCDSAPSQAPYFVAAPGASFSHYELQCAVNAIEDQRRANARIQHWEGCRADTPRLAALQERLREEWRIEQREKWEARCARETQSLRAVCNEKMQEAMGNYPDHLRIPPVYREILLNSLVVSEATYRRVKGDSDIRLVASGIVLDRLEANSAFPWPVRPTPTNNSHRQPERSQEEKDRSDLLFGGCAKWIGRMAPNSLLITEEYLDQQLAKCMAE